MVTVTLYKITVKGRLDEGWSDWFNGSNINVEHDSVDGQPQTVLTCRVRDQSELYGILTWLNGLNLTLINVVLIKNGKTGPQTKLIE